MCLTKCILLTYSLSLFLSHRITNWNANVQIVKAEDSGKKKRFSTQVNVRAEGSEKEAKTKERKSMSEWMRHEPKRWSVREMWWRQRWWSSTIGRWNTSRISFLADKLPFSLSCISLSLSRLLQLLLCPSFAISLMHSANSAQKRWAFASLQLNQIKK